jgi:hypothetical protein
MEHQDTSPAALKMLDRFAPTVLKDLRRKFPKAKGRFAAVGQVLGDDFARADAVGCLAALDVAIKLCEKASSKARIDISKTNKVVLAGTVFTATAGAAVFGVIAADAPKTAKYVAAILALLGSISSVVGNWMSRGTGGASMEDALKGMAGLSFELMRVRSRLSSRLQRLDWSDDTTRDVAANIASANKLCDEIQRFALIVGLVALNEFEASRIGDDIPEEYDVLVTEVRSGSIALQPEDPQEH